MHQRKTPICGNQNVVIKIFTDYLMDTFEYRQ